MDNYFEKFSVYKKSLEVAKEVDGLCKKAKGQEFNYLKDQIRRAASSILLNLAEGSGKWTKKDKANFYRISRGSAFECIAALDLFRAYKLVEDQAIALLKEQLKEIAGELQALIYSIEKRIK